MTLQCYVLRFNWGAHGLDLVPELSVRLTWRLSALQTAIPDKTRNPHRVRMPHSVPHTGLEHSKLPTGLEHSCSRLCAVNLLSLCGHVRNMFHVSDISAAAGVLCLIAYMLCGNEVQHSNLTRWSLVVIPLSYTLSQESEWCVHTIWRQCESGLKVVHNWFTTSSQLVSRTLVHIW